MKQKIRLHTIYSIQLADGTNKGLPIYVDVDWAQAPPAEVIHV